MKTLKHFFENSLFHVMVPQLLQKSRNDFLAQALRFIYIVENVFDYVQERVLAT